MLTHIHISLGKCLGAGVLMAGHRLRSSSTMHIHACGCGPAQAYNRFCRCVMNAWRCVLVFAQVKSRCVPVTCTLRVLTCLLYVLPSHATYRPSNRAIRSIPSRRPRAHTPTPSRPDTHTGPSTCKRTKSPALTPKHAHLVHACIHSRRWLGSGEEGGTCNCTAFGGRGRRYCCETAGLGEGTNRGTGGRGKKSGAADARVELWEVGEWKK